MAFPCHRRNRTLSFALALMVLLGPSMGFGQAQQAPKNDSGKFFLALHVGEFQLLYAPLLLGAELGLSLSPSFALTGQLEGSVPFPLSSQLGQDTPPGELSEEGDAIAAAGVRWFPMQGSFHIDAHLYFDRVTGWSIGTGDAGAGSYSNDLRTRLGPVVSI